jgi:dihydroorotase
LLSLTLKWADEDKIPLLAALAKVTSEPARLLGIEAGAIVTGTSADLCVFDPQGHWQVQPTALRSQGKNTPFTGYEMRGKVRYTLVEGQVVYQD